MFRQTYTTFAIAVAYALTAQLGYLATLLPGQSVTPFWPPSGIALAAVLIIGRKAFPGILLGAFVVNAWTHQAAPVLVILAVASMTSLASAFSALIAGEALKRIAPAAPDSISAWEIFKGCIALALACALAATGGVGSLYAFDLLPEYLLAQSWGLWWVGDYCGMIIFGPTVWLGARFLISHRTLKAAGPMAGAGLFNTVLGLVALLSFGVLWSVETTAISRSLAAESKVIANNLERILNAARNDLDGIRALTYASVDVSADEFRRYTAAAYYAGSEFDSSAQALGWVPRVTAPQAWIRLMQSDLKRGAPLYEINSMGDRVPVLQRDDYFPVQYIEPRKGNEAALGFDLGSEEQRRTALDRARDSGRVAMASPISLVQSGKAEHSILICLPIYRPDIAVDTLADRRANLSGFATGVYIIRVLFDKAASGRNTEVNLHLFDLSSRENSELYSTLSSRQEARVNSAESRVTLQGLQEALHGASTVNFAGHSWLLMAAPGPAFIQSQRTWMPWIALLFILAFGLSLSSILSERILARQSLAFEREKTSKAQLREQAANESKAYLMAAAAHDIKQPLYALGLLVDTLLMRKLPQDTVPVVLSLSNSIEQMSLQFDALMDFGKIQYDGFNVHRTKFRLGAFFERIDAEIAVLCANKGLAWNLVSLDVLVFADEELLLRLFRNLLTNAVSYTESGAVSCSAREEGGLVKFVIADTGIGIEKEQQKTVFEKFVRLEEGSMGFTGTGLGLSIVEIINQTLELNLEMFSIPGAGTRFTFELPIVPDRA